MNHYALQSLMMRNAPLRRWSMQRMVFLFPTLCIAASLFFFGETLWFQNKAKRTTGVVTKVYEWKNGTPFLGGDTVYAPVFRYTWSDGNTTQASAGHSFLQPFAEGEQHTILFDPTVKSDVRTTRFEQMWALPAILLILGLVTWFLALPIWLWIIRPRIKRQRERSLFILPGESP
ncbi:MAG: DUF3592 domain-containing protein [Beijerinckiaceae bacterium]|jgi:hypothetical protein|nr:DUF3592 domain-containing protein [Beijerinckiaceae bacterium]